MNGTISHARRQNKTNQKNIIEKKEGRKMKKTSDPLEEYFMKKFKEMGIPITPPIKGKSIKKLGKC